MKEQINTFLNYLAVEKVSSGNTIAAYRNDLYSLADYLQKGGHASWQSIGSDTLADYVLEIQNRGYSPTTLARKIASVKSFFAFLMDEGIVVKNPTEELRAPRIGRTLPKALSEEEVERLLRAPAQLQDPRRRAGQGHAGAPLRNRHARQRASPSTSTTSTSSRASSAAAARATRSACSPSTKRRRHPSRSTWTTHESRCKGPGKGQRPLPEPVGTTPHPSGLLAHPQGARSQRRHHHPRHPPHHPAQLRHPHAPGRSLAAAGPGVPGPRQHLDHPGLHASHGRPPPRRVRADSPAGKLGMRTRSGAMRTTAPRRERGDTVCR